MKVKVILGIGTDIIEIERIEKALLNTPKFSEKIYTQEEIEYFRKRGEKAEVLAGNFAVKEAFSKAIGTGFREMSPRDIAVYRDEKGKPYIQLSDKATKCLEETPIKAIHVSISHCKSLAIGYVVIEGGE